MASQSDPSNEGGPSRQNAGTKTRVGKPRSSMMKIERMLATKDNLMCSDVEGAKRAHHKRGQYLDDPRKRRDEGDDYEPNDHRNVTNPTTNIETFMHMLKGTCGTGILAMPHAFNDSGYVVGVIGTCVLGTLCTYCIHILLKCCYVICKRRRIPTLSYTAVTEASFAEGPLMFRSWAPYAATTANVFLIIYQVGICCVYVLFVSTNLEYALKNFNITVTVHQMMLIILIPTILLNYVRDLKYLAPPCAFANVVTIISFGIIYYYLFRDSINMSDKSPTGRPIRYPLFFGTVMFALEAIGVMIPLQNEMQSPKFFTHRFGVLNLGMGLNVSLYTLMGLFGYIRYGSKAEGSVTLNLPSQTEKLATAVQILLAIAIFISYALQCYVCIDIMWTDYISGYCAESKFKWLWEYMLRTAIVLFTFILSALVPALDLFISLFGALCLSALGFAFPAIIESCTYWHYIKGAERLRMTIKNACLIVIAILGLSVGTVSAMIGIINRFIHGIEEHSDYFNDVENMDGMFVGNETILH